MLGLVVGGSAHYDKIGKSVFISSVLCKLSVQTEKLLQHLTEDKIEYLKFLIQIFSKKSIHLRCCVLPKHNNGLITSVHPAK